MRTPVLAVLLAFSSIGRALWPWNWQGASKPTLPRRRGRVMPGSRRSTQTRGQSTQYPAVRYKKTSICETTEGVASYSGYIDLDEHSHLFFWFFEARRNAETAPITFWLNGGPGSDSLIGLFTEIGPCTVNPDLTTTLNPFSWSEYSNLLFLSQPLGVGFSYGTEGEGTFDGDGPPKYLVLNATATDTSRRAAMAAWKAVQAFLAELPRMSPRVASRDFNLWTESYGGHYGPSKVSSACCCGW
ncbi:serine carboxypeptidase-domain-containing protein [Coniochaeta sp. 2T2.1]|nr:serine carboxypeptidase-domain-containing protein [Coniochaeta sp. 2T2.1]